MLLVKFENGHWEASGFQLMFPHEYALWFRTLDYVDWDVNEGYVFNNTWIKWGDKLDFMRDITVETVSSDEAITLAALFKLKLSEGEWSRQYGKFPMDMSMLEGFDEDVYSKWWHTELTQDEKIDRLYCSPQEIYA